MRVTIIGAGVAGLVTALELAERGASVSIVERGSRLGEQACSWFAGGMLAPWCERESAEPAVVSLGQVALDWWPRHVPDVVQAGTLVIAPPRDIGELDRFARHTHGFEWLDGDMLGEREPDLAGRFRKALYFPCEAHLDPRRALHALAGALAARGIKIQFGVDGTDVPIDADRVVDCRGFAARGDLADLRGVRGEMVIVRSHDIHLARPVRLLHPRIPLYIVPRTDGCFMIGATMIESAERTGMTARSAVELLNGAYAIHPAFGEAEILEFGADVRPAFPDNLPSFVEEGRTIYFNGLFRHGFLLSPAIAAQVADRILGATKESEHETHRERQRA